jgi:hypothetical protein
MNAGFTAPAAEPSGINLQGNDGSNATAASGVGLDFMPFDPELAQLMNQYHDLRPDLIQGGLFDEFLESLNDEGQDLFPPESTHLFVHNSPMATATSIEIHQLTSPLILPTPVHNHPTAAVAGINMQQNLPTLLNNHPTARLTVKTPIYNQPTVSPDDPPAADNVQGMGITLPEVSMQMAQGGDRRPNHQAGNHQAGIETPILGGSRAVNTAAPAASITCASLCNPVPQDVPIAKHGPGHPKKIQGTENNAGSGKRGWDEVEGELGDDGPGPSKKAKSKGPAQKPAAVRKPPARKAKQ